MKMNLAMITDGNRPATTQGLCLEASQVDERCCCILAGHSGLEFDMETFNRIWTGHFPDLRKDPLFMKQSKKLSDASTIRDMLAILPLSVRTHCLKLYANTMAKRLVI